MGQNLRGGSPRLTAAKFGEPRWRIADGVSAAVGKRSQNVPQKPRFGSELEAMLFSSFSVFKVLSSRA